MHEHVTNFPLFPFFIYVATRRTRSSRMTTANCMSSVRSPEDLFSASYCQFSSSRVIMFSYSREFLRSPNTYLISSVHLTFYFVYSSQEFNFHCLNLNNIFPYPEFYFNMKVLETPLLCKISHFSFP